MSASSQLRREVFVEKRKPFQSAESRLQGLEGANDLIANAKEIQKDLNSANGPGLL